MRDVVQHPYQRLFEAGGTFPPGLISEEKPLVVCQPKGGTTIDLTSTTTGDVDWYVSFRVPFSSVAAFLDQPSVNIHINDASPLRYIVATSTQANSLNQDLGGVQGGVNSSTTWADLGGFTAVINPSGMPVPEPQTFIMAGTAALAMWRRRTRGNPAL